MPGRLELTVKFSELPRPRSVQDGCKIGIQTGEGIVTTILPAKVWRKLEQAAKDYPQWVAALSGALERFAAGEIALKHPAVQVFEKKAKPAVAPEGKASEPNGPEVKALEGKAPEGKAPAPKAPDGQAAKLPVAAETPKGAAAPPAARPLPTHIRATISLKGRAAPQ